MARPTYVTRTASGHTCHTRIPSKRAALRLAAEWSRRFPDQAPYSVYPSLSAVTAIRAKEA